MAAGDEETLKKPRVAQTVEAILKAMGVESYDPRVVNQLLELLYRHVSHVLDDARVFSEHADKQCINADDIKLAIRSRVNFAFTQPPPRDVTVRLAKERNAIPLPPVDSIAGVALPQPEFQLTAQNYKVIVDPNRNPAPLLKTPKSPKISPRSPRSPRAPKSPRSPKLQESSQHQKSLRTGNPTQFHKAQQPQAPTQFQNPMQNSKLVQKSPMRTTPPQGQRPSLSTMAMTQVQKSPTLKTPPQVQRPAQFVQSPQRQKISPMQRSQVTQKSPNTPKSPKISKSPRKSPKRPRTSGLNSPKRQKLNMVSQMPPPPEIVDLDGPGAEANAAHSSRQAGLVNQVRSPAGLTQLTSESPNVLMRPTEVITIADDPIVAGSGAATSSISPRSRMGQQNH